MNQAQTPTGDHRLRLAENFIEGHLAGARFSITSVSGDASFRRYFRVHHNEQTLILMDAPPEKESLDSFLDVTERLRIAGLSAPAVQAQHPAHGFLLLQDFGDKLYREHVGIDSNDDDFEPVFDILKTMAESVSADGLPRYDRHRLLTEMELYPRWFVEQHCGESLSCSDWDLWEALCTRLLQSAAAQPQVFVHRDFHSCNLLYREGQPPGIIDYQDAVLGPVSYDLASLIWDRYIPWPRKRLESFMLTFRDQIKLDMADQAWIRCCDFMGLQRNLKIVGIFARLNYRDGKSGYLKFLPRFYQYLMDVLPLYPELEDSLPLIRRFKSYADS